MTDLITLYQSDSLFRLLCKPVIFSRHGLKSIRDGLRYAMREQGYTIKFEMGDLRKLYYHLHPNENKRLT